MGNGHGLRASFGRKIGSGARRLLAAATGREASRLRRRSAPLHQYGRDVERQCYLFHPLEQRLIADQGLLSYFFFDQNLASLAFVRTEDSLNFNWSDETPDASIIPPGGGFSARFTGNITAAGGGSYVFRATFSDGMRFRINGATYGRWPTVAGDVDGDGDVDMDDFNAVSNNFGNTYSSPGGPGDLNGDLVVDLADLNGVLNTFGEKWGNDNTVQFRVDFGTSTNTMAFELDYFNHDGAGKLNVGWRKDDDASYTPLPDEAFTLPAPMAFGLNSPAGSEGSTLTLSGYFADPVGHTLTASVNWGDGSVPDTDVQLSRTDSHVGTLSASHPYQNSGTYAGTITLTGPSGTKDFGFTATVANASPSATPVVTLPSTPGGAATVSLADATDPSVADRTAGLRYSFSADQSQLATTYATATTASSHNFPIAGTGANTVYARVFDQDGGNSQYTITLSAADALMVWGPDTVDRGRPFTLSLPTATASGLPITRWSINWGDASDPDHDGTPGESIAGAPSTASHVFLGQPGNYTVTATATHAGGRYVYPPLTVDVRPALIMSGPDAAGAGDPLYYSVDGPGAAAAIWTVTVDGTPYLNGHGSTLAFSPDRPGTYQVEAVSLHGGTPYTAAISLSVSTAAPKVTISVPPVLFSGRSTVFGSTVTVPGGNTERLTYRWTIGNVDGVPITLGNNGANLLYSGSLSTYLLPPSLAPGTYTAILTVDDGRGGVTTTTRKFEILPDPGEGNYESAVVPVSVTPGTPTSRSIPFAVAEQADGKILVAGWTFDVEGIRTNARTAFIARFNSDLSLDTEFGRSGLVVNALAGGVGDYEQSFVWALAVDPVTQCIVITGTVATTVLTSSHPRTGIAVARYLPDGSPDPTFNAGMPWRYLPPTWGTWTEQPGQPGYWTGADAPVDWSGVPYAVEVLDDRSILVGGARTKYWRDAAGYWNDTLRSDDFLLLKLKPDGILDTSFNGGFAESVNPIGLPDAASWDALPAVPVGPPGALPNWLSTEVFGAEKHGAWISKILPQYDADGKLKTVLVGGTAFDWANKLDAPAVYSGGGTDFVLAMYDAAGQVFDGDNQNGFGVGGKVRTHFNSFNVHYNNKDWGPFQDDFLSDLRIIPASGGDPARILAVGAAPSEALSGSLNSGPDQDMPSVPQSLALAWYTLDGQPDVSMGDSGGGAHTGKFLSSIVVGGRTVADIRGPLEGTVAMAIRPTDGKIIISSPVFSSESGSGPGYPGTKWDYLPVGWAFTQVAIDAFGRASPDPTFGAVGDGKVMFSSPQPMPVAQAPSTVMVGGKAGDTDGHPLLPADLPTAVFTTSRGIVAVGEITLGDWNDKRLNNPPNLRQEIYAQTAMVIRYRTAVPTPTNLVATATGPRSVSLTWTPPTEGAYHGYVIARAIPNGDGTADPDDYQVVGYAALGDKTFIDTEPTLRPGTQYLYKIHAIDGRFNSSLANPLTTAVPTFAGPALASTHPDFSKYGLVETVYVAPDGTLVQSGTTLRSDVKYLLRAAGRLMALDSTGQQIQGVYFDAEYQVDQHVWTDLAVTGAGPAVDLGVAVNGPGTVRFYQNEYHVSEGIATARFTVVRTGGLAGPLTFSYDASDFTDVDGIPADSRATKNTHYVIQPNTITIPHGVSTATLTVTIAGDALPNNDRSFQLTLKDASQHVVSTATVRIVDDETTPTFDLSDTTISVDAGQPVAITIRRRGQSFGPAKVHIATANGTALASAPGDDRDYTALDTDVLFDSGELSRTIHIATHHRHNVGSRFFTIALTPATGSTAAIGDQATATVTLVDPEQTPTVAFDSTTHTVSEGDLATLTVTRTGSVVAPLTVPFTISGATALAGVDFGSPSPLKLIFPAGQSVASVTIPTVDDALRDPAETFTVTLGTPSNPSVHSNPTAATATVTIDDNETATVVQWNQSGYLAFQTDTHLTATVLRTGNRAQATTITVRLIPGTAQPGVDYVDFPIEGEEFTFPAGDASIPVPVQLLPGATGTFDLEILEHSPDAEFGPRTLAQAQIVDAAAYPSPTLQFAATQYSAGENDQYLRITVYRLGDTTQAVSVNYATQDGTATAGRDYTATSGTLHFSGTTQNTPDSHVQTIDIPLTDNSYADGTRSLNLTLSSPSTGAVLGDVTSATLSIHDNDAPAVVHFGAPYLGPIQSWPTGWFHDSTTESVGTYRLTVYRTGNTAGTSTVTYVVTGGSAQNGPGKDYTLLATGTVFFGENDSQKDIEIAIHPNAAAASARNIQLALNAPSAGTEVRGRIAADIVIVDDDVHTSVVQFASPTMSVDPGHEVLLPVIRSGANLTSTVSVDWAAAGGNGLRPHSGTVIFGPGEQSVSIKLRIPINAVIEGREPLVVTLTGAKVIAGAGAAVVGTINRTTVTTINSTFGFAGDPVGSLDPQYSIDDGVYRLMQRRTLTVRRDGDATGVASVAWWATWKGGFSDLINEPHFASGTVYFQPGQKFAEIVVGVPPPVWVDPSKVSIDGHRRFTRDAAGGWVTVTLGHASGASIRMPGAQSYPTGRYLDGRSDPGQVAGGGHAIAALAAAIEEVHTNVGFSAPAYVVNEGADTIDLEVQRDGDNTGPLTVKYTTTAGTATATADFDPVTAGIVTFLPGETSRFIRIQIHPDDLAEPNEHFSVHLFDAEGASGETVGYGTQTTKVVIAPLTDAEKSPKWGLPSKQSDHSYEILQVGDDQPLVLNYRPGHHLSLAPDPANPLRVEIYAPRPSPVSQLVAAPDWTGTSPAVRLAWQSPEDEDADYYWIERSTDGGNTYSFLAAVPLGSTSFVDSTAAQNTPYAYRVISHGGGAGLTNASNQAHALLINRPPALTPIATQMVRPDASFEYQVAASDPEDGSDLHYEITVLDDTGQPSDILTIDQDSGAITSVDASAAWPPTQSDIGKVYRVTVKASEKPKSGQSSQSTQRTFSLVVLSNRLAPPSAAIQSPTFIDGHRAATLSSAAPAGLNYLWSVLKLPNQPDATLDDPTSPQPTIRFTKSGNYKVSLRLTHPADPTASVTVYYQFPVNAVPSHLLVSALPGDIEPDEMDFPEKFPDVQSPIVIGKGRTQYFATTLYDQFGDPYATTGNDDSGPHRAVDWELLNSATGTPIISEGNLRSISLLNGPQNPTGNFTLRATKTVDEQATLTGSLTVDFATLAPPTFSITPGPDTPTGRHLSISNLNYAGHHDNLRYHWSVANHPEITFTNNGTHDAASTVITFPQAGHYADLDVRLTVTDIRNGLTTTVPLGPWQPLTLTAVDAALVVTPSHPTVPAGGQVQLTATRVDQFGNPLSPQPPTVNWSVTGLLNPNHLTVNGNRATYAVPSSAAPGATSFLGNVTVSVPGLPEPVIVPINLGIQAPPNVSLRIDGTPDPLAQSAGANIADSRPLIASAQPVRAIIHDPAGGEIRWTLSAIPDGATEGTILLTGTGPAGSMSHSYATLGTIAPTQLPNGIYTLMLHVTARYPDGDGYVETHASASRVIQVRSAVKLGNMALPVTDLTENVPGADPITVSRSYDSQRAGQDGPLGHGWTLDALAPALVTTQQVQYAHQRHPKTGAPGGGTSLAWNDLVYVTLPDGRQHAFAFRPIPMLDPGTFGAGLVSGIVTYLPNFVPVDGSATTLQPSDNDGNPRSDDILWDWRNGYMFRGTHSTNGYNPALNEFGGHYLLTTVDGTRYLIDAVEGKLLSRTDLLGKTQTFSGNTLSTRGTVTATSGTRTVTATPTAWDNNHITTIVTSMKDGTGNAVPLQQVDYGYDSAGNLLGSVVRSASGGADRRKTTYSYADRLVLSHFTPLDAPAPHAIIRDSLGRTWTGTEFLTGGTPHQITLDPAGVRGPANAQTAEWFSAAIPDQIPSGTSLEVSYYNGPTLFWTETRQYNGPQPHLLTGVIEGDTDSNGGGVKLLSATYHPTNHQLTQLTNVWNTAAQTTTNHTGDHPSQTVTDPSGGQTYTEFDDHGNAVREIRTVFDASGTRAQYYVVTLRDFAYADPGATDYSRTVSNGKYDNPWPMVNVVRHQYTSTPFVIPAANANHRFFSVDSLKAHGYLKTYSAGGTTHILWASKQEYDSTGRYLATSETLRTDGNYDRTQFRVDESRHVFGRPEIVRTVVVSPIGKEVAGSIIDTHYSYNDGKTDQNYVNSSPKNIGTLKSSIDQYGRTTYYLYGGDTLPGGSGGEGDPPPDDVEIGPDLAPAGALYATFRKDHQGQPIFLTESRYHATTTATPTTPGAVQGLLSQSTDHSTGLTTLYNYWPDGRPAEVWQRWGPDPDDTVRLSRTQYDALGRVIATTDSHDQTTTTSYDSAGRVDTTTDPYGGVTRHTYDAAGNLIRTLYPDGTETRTAYDDLGRPTWRTDRHHTGYGATPGPDDAKPALATLTLYDRQGRAIATERRSGVVLSITDDTSAGVPGLKKSSLASPGALLSTTSTTFDPLGRVVQTTDAAGLRTGTIYHPTGQPRYTGILKDTTSDNPASPWYATLPPDPTPQFLDTLFSSYTSTAHQASGTGAPHDGFFTHDVSTDALGHHTRTYRDNKGLDDLTLYHDGTYSATYRNDPAARTSDKKHPVPLATVDKFRIERDSAVQPTQAEGWQWWHTDGAAYLPEGYSQVIQVAQRRPTDNIDDPIVTTIHVYDAAGRLTDVWLPAVDDAKTTDTTAKLRPHWHYTYDPRGNQLTQSDPNSHTTHFVYNKQGQRITRTLPAVNGASVSESWTYDPRGRTRSHTDFNGQTTAYVYDNSPAHGGRLTAEYRFTTHEGQPHGPTFSADGTLLNPDDAAERTQYSYDPLARQLTVADSRHTPDTPDSWTAQTATHHTYDPITGQVASVRTTTGQQDIGTIHYTYDPATSRKTSTHTAHNHTAYTYDPQGRLKTVTAVKLNGQVFGAEHPQITAYTYDLVGNLKTVTHPTGLTTTYTYDDLNRLTHESVTRDDPTTTTVVEATPVMTFDYTLRSDGLRDDVTETRYEANGTDVFSQTHIDYKYDAAARLAEESLTVVDGAANAPAPYTHRYAFDPSGNRITKTTDANNDGPTGDVVITYDYNERDQLTTEGVDGDDEDTLPDSPGATTYTYDDNGSTTHVTTPTGTKRYAWDLRNRMVGLDANNDNDLADPGDVTYAYDPSGVRLSQTPAGDATTYYLNDPDNPTGYTKAIEEKTTPGAAPTRSYILGHKVEGQSQTVTTNQQTTQDVAYLLTDGHGSTRALTTLNGAVTQRYDYDAFGNPLTFDPLTAQTPWLFGGDGAYDPATGWTYHLARWRSDFRFTSYDSFEADPASPSDLHKYLYARDNPSNGTDPTGEFCYTDSLVAAGVAGFLSTIRGAYDALVNTAGEAASILLQTWTSDYVNILNAYMNTTGLGDNFDEQYWDVWSTFMDSAEPIGTRQVVDPCFAAGTQVAIPTEGGGKTTKSIEAVSVGELVLARDEHGPESPIEPCRVGRVYRRFCSHLRSLVLRDHRGCETEIKTTDEHPFWLEPTGWTAAGDLPIGSRVKLCGDSTAVIISSNRAEYPDGITVFNLHVEGARTYFVSGKHGEPVLAWVHNTCAGRHHIDPRSWGDPVPYGDQSLTHFPEKEHTWITKEFSKFLKDRTGSPFNGKSGREWQERYDANERAAMVEEFVATIDADPANKQKLKTIAKHPKNQNHGWNPATVTFKDMLGKQRLRAQQIADGLPPSLRRR